MVGLFVCTVALWLLLVSGFGVWLMLRAPSQAPAPTLRDVEVSSGGRTDDHVESEQ
jgi:hypothetical protein